MLSSKTAAFIKPWNKLFCSLLTEVHASHFPLKLWPPYFCVSSTNRRYISAPVQVCVFNIPRSL